MTDTTRSIVTPEGVILDLETAGIASRALARTIDAAAQAAAIFVLLIALGAAAAGGVPDWFAVVVLVVGVAAVIFGYPALFEGLWRGRTPGKAALGLRVYTEDGAPIRWLHAFIRSVMQLVDFILLPGGLLAVLSALFTRRSQRLGDLVAGTVVLRERSAQRAPMPVSFPPPYGWDGYAATLDVGGLRDAQYRLVRSFLLRVDELSPGSRASLGLRLATAVRDRMQHVPPPGLHPELFLVCVAAAYQRRHGAPGGPPGAAFGAPPAAGPPPAPPPPPPASWGPAPPR
jgi:uncharacterized RDD family membrane protein YckC